MARGIEDQSSENLLPLEDFESVSGSLVGTGESEKVFTENQITEKTIPFPQELDNGDKEPEPPPIHGDREKASAESSFTASEEQKKKNADIIEKVVQGNHFSSVATKYLDNLIDGASVEDAPKGAEKRMSRFNTAFIEEDLDYGQALKEKRLSSARLAGGIVGGISSRMKVGGEKGVGRLVAPFNRKSVIEARGALIDFLRKEALKEREKTVLADFLSQLADNLEDVNDRDRMLNESPWYKPNITVDLSDKALEKWRAESNHDVGIEVVSDKPSVAVSVEEEAKRLVDKALNRKLS